MKDISIEEAAKVHVRLMNKTLNSLTEFIKENSEDITQTLDDDYASFENKTYAKAWSDSLRSVKELFDFSEENIKAAYVSRLLRDVMNSTDTDKE